MVALGITQDAMAVTALDNDLIVVRLACQVVQLQSLPAIFAA